MQLSGMKDDTPNCEYDDCTKRYLGFLTADNAFVAVAAAAVAVASKHYVCCTSTLLCAFASGLAQLPAAAAHLSSARLPVASDWFSIANSMCSGEMYDTAERLHSCKHSKAI
jgi:hypothetical protein